MTEAAAGALPAEAGTKGAPHVIEQVGASTFSDLVRAHFAREQERANGAATQNGAEGEYTAQLERFEDKEGTLAAVYWSTRNASAVALTVGRARHKRNPIVETDTDVRLHRVTDWVTKSAEPIAELLHECDVLAIRVREILRGTSQRIAMQWIYSVQEHALGFLERSERRDVAKERAFVTTQRKELGRIEKYYLRAGAKAGRIVYVSGMIAAAAVIVALCAALAIALSLRGAGAVAAPRGGGRARQRSLPHERDERQVHRRLRGRSATSAEARALQALRRQRLRRRHVLPPRRGTPAGR